MSADKFQEPELADPRTLQAGDQVACLELSAKGYTLVVTAVEYYADVVWRTLWNVPGKCHDVHGVPVRETSVALQFGPYDHDWKIMPVPQVLARRRIA